MDDYSAETYKNNIVVPRGQNFVFGVQACNDAHLGLTSTPGDVTQMAYEIVLGANRNSRSDLRNGMQVIPLMTSRMMNHLSWSSFVFVQFC